jgi:hypothetical protein
VGAGFFEEEAIANLQRALEPLPPPLPAPKAEKKKRKPRGPARRGRDGWQKVGDLVITVEGVGERDAAIWHDFGTPVSREMGHAGAWEARSSGYTGRGDTKASALEALGEAWESDPTPAAPVLDVFGLEDDDNGDEWTQAPVPTVDDLSPEQLEQRADSHRHRLATARRDPERKLPVWDLPETPWDKAQRELDAAAFARVEAEAAASAPELVEGSPQWARGAHIPKGTKGAPLTPVVNGSAMHDVRIAKNGIKFGDRIQMQGWGAAGSDDPRRWYVQATKNTVGAKPRHYKVTTKQAEKILDAIRIQYPTVGYFREPAADPDAANLQVRTFEALRWKDRSQICAQLGIGCDDLAESLRAAAFPPPELDPRGPGGAGAAGGGTPWHVAAEATRSPVDESGFRPEDRDPPPPELKGPWPPEDPEGGRYFETSTDAHAHARARGGSVELKQRAGFPNAYLVTYEPGGPHVHGTEAYSDPSYRAAQRRRDELRARGYRAMSKARDLQPWGYQIVVWFSPSEERTIYEYAPDPSKQTKGHDRELVRMTAETLEEQKAVHARIGVEDADVTRPEPAAPPEDDPDQGAAELAGEMKKKKIRTKWQKVGGDYHPMPPWCRELKIEPVGSRFHVLYRPATGKRLRSTDLATLKKSKDAALEIMQRDWECRERGALYELEGTPEFQREAQEIRAGAAKPRKRTARDEKREQAAEERQAKRDLAEAVKRAKAHARSAKSRARSTCARARLRTRAWGLEERRKTAEKIARRRALDQARCESNVEAAQSKGGAHVERARDELAAYRLELKREKTREAIARREAITANATERDHEVLANLTTPEELIVWRKVGRTIKASPHASRYEMFMQWIHDNSQDVERFISEDAERAVDELETLGQDPEEYAYQRQKAAEREAAAELKETGEEEIRIWYSIEQTDRGWVPVMRDQRPYGAMDLDEAWRVAELLAEQERDRYGGDFAVKVERVEPLDLSVPF